MLLKRALALLAVLAGCGRCGSSTVSGGATPYVRCLLAEPPAVAPALGPLQVELRERVLEIRAGLPEEPRVAFFQGAGMETAAPVESTLQALRDAKPDLLVMLGGVATDAQGASPTLHALTALGIPLLFVAGGRDTTDGFELARSHLPQAQAGVALNISALETVVFHRDAWSIVAGTEDGRSGIANESCGFSRSDVASRRDQLVQLTEQGYRATLVSWEIPSGTPGGLARSLGFDLGSAALQDAYGEQHRGSGFHAWPDVQVMRPMAENTVAVWGQSSPRLSLVVPRIDGPAHERGDGTRQPSGFVIVRFAKAGLVPEAPR